MQTQAIIPVLKFFGRNKSIMDLGSIAAQLGMHPDNVRLLVMDAEIHGKVIAALADFQIIQLLQWGERLGVIHKGTEFEILPVQGEFTICEDQPATAEFIAYAKNHLAQKIGAELHKQGLISFDVLAWQQVQQKNPHGRDWQVKAKLQALKEK